MLGFLLARQGIAVTVLEKHKDFFRDFRGDTIHPSTLDLMHELGVLDAFLALPHQKICEFVAAIGGESFPIADLSHLPTHAKFVALMPQGASPTSSPPRAQTSPPSGFSWNTKSPASPKTTPIASSASTPTPPPARSTSAPPWWSAATAATPPL